MNSENLLLILKKRQMFFYFGYESLFFIIPVEAFLNLCL